MQHHDPDPFDVALTAITLALGALWSVRRELRPPLHALVSGTIAHVLTDPFAASPWRTPVVIAAAGVAALLSSRRWWTPAQLAAGRAARHRWLIRYRWPAAAKAVGLVDPGGDPPRLGRLRSSGATTTTRLRIPRGLAADDVQRMAQRLASALQVRSIRVEPHPSDASRCQLTLRSGDPLRTPTQWTPRTVVQGHLEIGTDEDGAPATVPLLGRSLLIGGVPGAGKSSVLQGVIAAAVATPGWRVALCDPKRVELASWRDHVESYAVAANDVLQLLDAALADMDRRYRHMEQRGLRTADPADPATPPLLVVVDELAAYTGHADAKGRQAVRTTPA